VYLPRLAIWRSLAVFTHAQAPPHDSPNKKIKMGKRERDKREIIIQILNKFLKGNKSMLSGEKNFFFWWKS